MMRGQSRDALGLRQVAIHVHRLRVARWALTASEPEADSNVMALITKVQAVTVRYWLTYPAFLGARYATPSICLIASGPYSCRQLVDAVACHQCQAPVRRNQRRGI